MGSSLAMKLAMRELSSFPPNLEIKPLFDSTVCLCALWKTGLQLGRRKPSDSHISKGPFLWAKEDCG